MTTPRASTEGPAGESGSPAGESGSPAGAGGRSSVVRAAGWALLVVAALAALVVVPRPSSRPDLPLWARALVAVAKSGPILVVGLLLLRARVRSGQGLRLRTPALGLVVLSPLVAEYLLGNVTFEELPAAPILMLLYGCPALAIREAARRTGRGWPTMLTLAAAFGLLLPGVIDQSLFNPSFEGWEFQAATPVPALGIGADSAITFVAGHVIWSIGAPIALVEALAPARAGVPWLGRRGLVATGAGFVLGAAVVFSSIRESEQFLASPAQLGVTLVLVVLLVVAAFRMFPPLGPAGEPAGRPAPRPWTVGVGAFVASSGFAARGENWLTGVVGALIALALAAVVVARLSRRPGWGPAHRFALAAGAVVTYGWLGFLLLDLSGSATPVNVGGQFGLVAAAAVLLVVTGLRIRVTGEGATVSGPGHRQVP